MGERSGEGRAQLRIKTGGGWPVGDAMLAARDGQPTEVFMDDQVIAWIVPAGMAEYALRHGWGR